MKTNYERLVEKLKEVPEIKEDLETLKYGCTITYTVREGHTRKVGYISKNYKTNELLVKHEYNYFHPRRILQSQVLEICNPLQERHLRMYCETKGTSLYAWYGLIDLNNTKDFHLQDDEVYGKILDYLNNN